MHKIAELSGNIKKLSDKVDQYFVNNGFNIEELRCGNGVSLDELDYGNDVTDRFCKHAENNFSDSSLWNIDDMKMY